MESPWQSQVDQLRLLADENYDKYIDAERRAAIAEGKAGELRAVVERVRQACEWASAILGGPSTGHGRTAMAKSILSVLPQPPKGAADGN